MNTPITQQESETYFKNLSFQKKGNTYHGGYVRRSLNEDGYHGRSATNEGISAFFYEAAFKKIVAGEEVTIHLS